MTDENPPARRVRAIVEGRVQGVGYRFFARRAARELGIAGWVRNRRDGRVEAEAAGEPAAVEAFLRRLREGPAGGRVEKLEVSEMAGAVEERDFEIRT